MSIRRTFLFFVALFVATRADAQFAKSSDVAAGEQYHVEFSAMFWTPTPQLSLSTGGLSSLGVPNVDFVQEFGIEKERFTEYRFTSKPGRKHKFHFSSVPFSYKKDAVITRNLTFGGLTVPVSAPASTDISWKIRRYGYEWDFVAMDRGYLGLLADVKDNKLTASVDANPYGSESTDVRVWVPTVGLAARGYPHRLFSVTGEFSVELTRFKGFDRFKDGWDGKYVDFDLYGTMNFGRNVAAQAGYRSVVVDYSSDDDTANLRMKGLYWGGTVRF